jgi:transcriptional regulator with XRE-family HTH domain
MNSVGTRIKYFRKLKNISRENLANELGISIHTLSKYEQGQREPKFGTLQRIADILMVSIARLIHEENDPVIDLYEGWENIKNQNIYLTENSALNCLGFSFDDIDKLTPEEHKNLIDFLKLSAKIKYQDMKLNAQPEKNK